MEMIDLRLNRLQTRLKELSSKLVPDLDAKATVIYARIMPLPLNGELRLKLEAEYTLISKELKLRSNEIIDIRHEIDNLELERTRRKI
jgi:hypothetical protein